ncbi:MAG TPA: efflux RND transporter periplasmic adaptor subunit [Candidatus Polarisedimenticolaceae bacterium]|nr:efflux RND transporter periplasmic adaptor subunit [Candidatus Polarisedimenticolaceae bacterium]
MMRSTCALGAVALLVAGAGCTPSRDDQKIEFSVPVFVREAATGSVEDRIVVTGSLRSPETVTLRADTSGVLECAHLPGGGRRLAEGDRVAVGQLVAEIKGEEVRLAARSDSTRQRYESALRDRDSKRRLYEQGLLSELEFRQVETAFADAKVEWERSQLTETRSRLVSPIAGVLLRLARDEQNNPLPDGQLVPQGTTVAQVAATTRLVADVDLVGSDVGRVREGMPARVRQPSAGGEPVEGRLVRLAPALDALTRTLRAEVHLDNPQGRLRPGMFVEVTIVAERRENVVVVPREAVAERGGGKVVFVLDGQKVNKRDVVLGLGDDESVEVRSGLKTGERIVVRGIETLTDGTKVRVSGA